jgi:hypothetical protein
MEDILRLEVEPIGKPRMTQRDKWMKRPPVVRYHLFSHAIKYCAEEVEYVITDTLSLTFIISMPKSWSNKKKKAFKDCLCEDDSFIHTYQNVRKIWGEKGCILIHR